MSQNPTTHHPDTLTVHAGQEEADSATNARAVPIYQTTSYVFDDTEHAADLFALKVPGNIYTRIMNPTQSVFEARVNALEGGVGALATASGSAAVTYAVLNLTYAGDNIVALSTLYGGTYALFAHTLPQYGIEVRFVDPGKPEELAASVDEKTKLVFGETIGNPAINVIDLDAWSAGRARPRPAVHRRRHRDHPDPRAGLRARRRHRRPLGHQVHRRPRHLDRRHPRRLRQVRLGRPRRPLPRPHRARTPPTTAWSGPMPPAPPPTSSVPGRCCCATPAQRSRRSTPGCSCRASRPSTCASSATRPTRSPSRSTSRATTRWPG